MRFTVLQVLLLLSLSLQAGETSLTYADAAAAYDAENYEESARALETLIESEPDCAECAHLLGKAYGRMAEQASWINAVSFAKKTRAAFESAVELDPLNDAALEDLIRFYRSAPGFLGGSEKKADELERRLQALRNSRTG